MGRFRPFPFMGRLFVTIVLPVTVNTDDQTKIMK